MINKTVLPFKLEMTRDTALRGLLGLDRIPEGNYT